MGDTRYSILPIPVVSVSERRYHWVSDFLDTILFSKKWVKTRRKMDKKEIKGKRKIDRLKKE